MAKTGRHQKENKRRSKVFIVLLLVFIFVIIALFADSNLRLVTTKFELHYPNLPSSFDGFRIALIADIHGSEHGENNERLIRRIKDAEPDIIAIAGDLVDDHQRRIPLTRQFEIAETLVSALVEIAPVYFVTGNHEWDIGNTLEFLNMLRDWGVVLLRNDYVLLERGGQSIILVGIDDPHGPADMPTPREVIGRITETNDADFMIVMYHRNYKLPLFSELGVDLLLSGHAHGGLVRLPFTDGLIGTRRDFFPTHTSGVYTMGTTFMIVTRGIGNHYGWSRFLNNPEVVIIELSQQ
jgi:predicted MPP superfamily phosphohydrolase